MLHGRHGECAAIDRLLADAGELRSGALVVRGEVGVGKSALLAYAADRAAENMRVLWGAGVESESELAFAALHQLVRPVLDHVERLPGPQAAALQGAFGLATTNGTDRFLIGVGALSLLAEVAEERPLVCLVDDAQWLDQPSTDALSFAARRLEAEGVVLLVAARDDDLHTFTAPSFEELRLTGLDADAAGALLTEQSPAGLAPNVRARLIEATQGNPLALLELPSSLNADQLAGRAPLPDPLPVSAGVERVFLERVRRLPESTQTLLLAAAAEETGDLAVILRAGRALGTGVQAFGMAETAGLVRIAEGRIRFHHPLVRSAVYRGATFSQRQAVHQELAAALEGEEYADRRAWHRAAAATEPAPEVADELERSAERARRRSGYAAAARALERSAALTAAEKLRSRRLADAADAAWLAGQPDRALGLLDRAAGGVSAPRLRADIAHLRGVIELRRGVPADAFTILTAGAAEVAPVDPVKALAMLLPASEAASYAGDVALTIEAARRASSLPRGGQRIDQFTVGLLVGIGSILEGDTARGAPLLREAVVLAQTFDDPSRLGFAGAAARYLGDDTATHDFYGRAVARARATGELVLLPYLLESLAVAEVAAGRYAAATASASEGLRLARETGQESSVCRNLSTLALLTPSRAAASPSAWSHRRPAASSWPARHRRRWASPPAAPWPPRSGATLAAGSTSTSPPDEEIVAMSEQVATVRKPPPRTRRIIQVALSLLLVVAIFYYLLRGIDLATVWAEIQALTWLEMATLVAIAGWNLCTYAWVWMSVTPGLSFWRAMVMTQATTAVANTIPAGVGAAVGIGMTYTMLGSWGYSRSRTTTAVLVSGVWNSFIKLGLPVLALALVVLQGDATGGRVVVALLGIAGLAAAVVVFALMLRSEEVARRFGLLAGRVASRLLRLVRRPPVAGWELATVKFRTRTVGLVQRRWIAITVTSLASHLSLFLVLLVTLRHVGVSDAEVGWAQVLAVFAFARLATAIPLTPGGAGFVEAVLIGGLVAAGGARPQVVAAVLVYRALTWLLPIPVGVVTYLWWRRRSFVAPGKAAPTPVGLEAT